MKQNYFLKLFIFFLAIFSSWQIEAQTFINAPSGELCRGGTEIYETQSGMSNYVWTYSGTFQQDYFIINGSSASRKKIRWDTPGDKTVTVSYTDPATGLNTTTASTTSFFGGYGGNFQLPLLASSENPVCGTTVTYTIDYSTTTVPADQQVTRHNWNISPSSYRVISGGGNSDDFITIQYLDDDNYFVDCQIDLEYTAHNNLRCSGSAISFIRMDDRTGPVALCQNITIPLDGTGNATITAAQIDGGSTDNGCIASTSVSQSSFTCADVGINIVTLTVTDAAGQTDSCQATVTVVDNMVPTITCIEDATRDTDAGLCEYTVQGTEFDGTFTDNCSNGTITNNLNGTTTISGENLQSGETTVIWTVDDGNGQIATCTTVITVVDGEAPKALTQDITVELDANGQVNITAAQINNGSSDLCGDVTLSLDKTTFDCSNVGISDGSLSLNNSSTTTNISAADLPETNFTIEFWFQTTNPMANLFEVNSSGHDRNIFLNNGALSARLWSDQTIISNVSNLNDGLWHHVSWTVQSGIGNNLYVDGNPVASGNKGQSDFDWAASFFLGSTVYGTPNNGSLDEFRLWNRVLSSTEINTLQNQKLNGNESGLLVYYDFDSNTGGGAYADKAALGGLNNINSIGSTSINSTTGPLGGANNVVTLTVTDPSGNESANTAIVTVEDNIAPEITCIANDTRNTDQGECVYMVNGTEFDATFTDNCSKGTITNNLNGTTTIAGEILQSGETTVIWTVDDGNGQSATCTTVITILDGEAPAAIAQNITVALGPNGQATIAASDINNGSTDNCNSTGDLVFSLDRSTFDCSDISSSIEDSQTVVTNTINWQKSSVSENGGSPGSDWGGISGSIPANSSYTIIPSLTSNPAKKVSPAAESLYSEDGVRFYRTSFNIKSISSQVSLEAIISADNAVQVFINGINVALEGTWSGNNFNPPFLGFKINQDGSTTNGFGNPNPMDYVIPNMPNNWFNAGSNEIVLAVRNPSGSNDIGGISASFEIVEIISGASTILTVTDKAGNSSTATATVTVQDNTSPEITCPENITQDNDPRTCGAIVDYVTPIGTDNCSGVTTVQTEGLASGELFPIGTTTNTFVTTDASGHTATCSFDVVITDVEEPQITCPNSIVTDTDPGSCTARVTFSNPPIVVDNCVVETTQTAGLPSGSNFPIGDNLVEFTTTDGTFTKTCSFTITVEDNFAPTITCIADITLDTNAGECEYTVQGDEFDATFEDNCSSATITNDFNGLSTLANTTLPKGENTIVWTVDDGNGQTATCTTVITIEDNEVPIITCPNDIEVSTDEGVCGAVVSFGDEEFYSSIFGNELVKINVISGEFTSIGPFGYNNTYTITFTPDGKAWTLVNSNQLGSVNIETGNVTPIGSPFSFGSYSIDSDSSGELFVLGSDSNLYKLNLVTGKPTLIGNTGLRNQMDIAFDKFDKLYAINSSKNLYSINTVTGELKTETSISGPVQNEMGLAINSDGTFYLTEHSYSPRLYTLNAETGETTFITNIAAQLPHGGDFSVPHISSSDNCPESTVVQTSGLPSGSIFPVGTTTNTFVVTDSSGNTATCSFDVIVKDNEAPVLVTEADQDVILDADCSITVPNLVDGSSATDNCLATITQSPIAGTIVESSHNGTVEVIVTATDAADNKVESTVVLTAKDNEAPVLAAEADQEVVLDADCSITVPNLVDGSSATDNCMVTITQSPIAGTIVESSHNGTVEVVVTATDAADNKVESTVVLTAKDNEAPVLVAEADQDVILDADCSITVPNLVDGSSATDNCTVTITQSPVAGTIVESSHNGTVEVIVTATDAADNKVESTVVLTAKDNEAPVLAAEADQEVVLDADCSITVPNLVDGSSATDNCMVTITQSPVAGTIVESSHNGTVEVIVTATDAADNKFESTVVLTAKDNEAPVLAAEADQDVILDADCSITVPNLVDGSSATDNCMVTITQSPVAGTIVESSHNGTVEVVVTATDAADNKVESTVVLTTKDNEAPVLIAEANQEVVLDADCSITVPNLVDGSSATDNCTVTITQSPVAGTIVESSHNGTVEVVVTATDAADNIVESTVVLTAKDNEAPVLAVEADQDVILDADCSITVPNLVDGSSATDNCMATITQSPVAGTIVESSHNGTVEVVVTATDAADNIDESTVVLTAKDNEAPVLAAEANQDVVLDADCSITVPNLVDGSSATDNCTVTITQSPVAGTIVESSHNGTVEVLVTAIDAADNKVESTVVLTAKDNEAPVLAAEADQDVILDADCSITVPNLVDGSSATDNCMATITQSPVAGTIVESSHNGTVEVIVTATDAADNIDESTVVLTAKDNEAPVLIAEADQEVVLDADCSITIPNLVDGSSATDNCIVTITQTPIAGTIVESSHNGTVEVVVTATDAANNKVESTVVLTAKDVTAPIADADQLDNITGECEVVESDVTAPTATDNCGGDVRVSHNVTFPITAQGLTVITWSFEDVDGNIATQTQDVMLEDLTAPVPDVDSLEDIIVECEVASIAAPTATDNCAGIITGTTLDPTSYSEEGEYMILWEFHDGNGNVATQEQWVTVQDQTAPEVSAQDLTVTVTQDEPAVITPEEVNDGSTDNCGDIVFTLDRDTFDKPGVYQVVLTATDASGNTSQATAKITVKREGADPKDAHVVPTMLTRTSIAKVILPFNGRISEVHVMETETNNYRVFDGNKKNTMQIDIAPMKGTLLVKIIDAEGNVYMKKLIAL